MAKTHTARLTLTLPPFFMLFFPVQFVKLYLELTIKYHVKDYSSKQKEIFHHFVGVHFVKLYLELTIKHHIQDYSSAASD